MKVFVDLMSQPSRAVLLFLECNSIPYEQCAVHIAKLQHRSPEFAKINPSMKLPAILDGDFNLSESHTILRYIAGTRDCAAHWYPKDDAKMRARIDEWLDWHHLNLRYGGQNYIFNKVLGPAMGAPENKQAVELGLKALLRSLKFLENSFVSHERPFLTGDQLTIADLSLFCEIDQFRVDPSLGVEASFPQVYAWTNRVRQGTSPHYEKIAVVLEKAVLRFAKL